MLHQLARFSSIAPFVEEVGAGAVVDVGSGSEGIATWLGPEWSVTAVDASFDYMGALTGPGSAALRQIEGDARALPFEEGAFDVALALDVLEHIPPADRARVVAELVRVARRRVIVAGPCGRPAFAADVRLAQGLRARGLTLPSWLEEHEAHGFPSTGELREGLAPHGSLRLIGNESVRWHDWLFRFEFRRPGAHTSRAASRWIAAGLGGGPLTARASRLAVRAVRGPSWGPSYRTIAVLDLID